MEVRHPIGGVLKRWERADTAGGNTGGGGTSPTANLPTGAGYTLYTSIYSAGDTMRQVLAKVPAGNILTLPDGIYEWANFNDPLTYTGSSGFLFDGLVTPSNCKGIIGNSTTGTILRMTANTSTVGGFTNAVPPSNDTNYDTNQCSLMQIMTPNFVMKNLQVMGTPQGHPYNGVGVLNASGVTITNVFFNGCAPGFAGFPPGETFAFSTNHADNCSLINCEVDGRDPITKATNYGASPCGWNNSQNAYLEGCYFHHSRYSTLTFWQTTGIHTKNCRVEYCGTQGVLNMENVAGTVWHENLTLFEDFASNTNDNHVSLNNGSYPNNPNISFTGLVYNGDPDSQNCFSLDIASGYVDANGNAQKQTSFPTVTDSQGRTLTGVHGGGNPATTYAVWF